MCVYVCVCVCVCVCVIVSCVLCGDNFPESGHTVFTTIQSVINITKYDDHMHSVLVCMQNLIGNFKSPIMTQKLCLTQKLYNYMLFRYKLSMDGLHIYMHALKIFQRSENQSVIRLSIALLFST